jgi:hypothetical protein
MPYPVRCECGQTHQVEAPQAGSRFPCSCRREVIVPSLSKLKASAGETALTPDVRVQQMLDLGMLPEETRCLGCGKETTGVRYFWATCERAFVKKDASRVWWVVLLGWLFLGWWSIILLLARARDDRVHGTDVSFRLPLRLCPECGPDLDRPGALRERVHDVPIYTELLDKYPNAELAVDVPKKGVNLSAPAGE